MVNDTDWRGSRLIASAGSREFRLRDCGGIHVRFRENPRQKAHALAERLPIHDVENSRRRTGLCNMHQPRAECSMCNKEIAIARGIALCGETDWQGLRQGRQSLVRGVRMSCCERHGMSQLASEELFLEGGEANSPRRGTSRTDT